MAAAYLDAQLEKLLKAYFVDDPNVADELLGRSKALSTFASRIDMTYALGFIGPQTRRDLHLIRKTRNLFGHEYRPLTFEDQPISARCQELYHHVFDKDFPPRKIFTRTVMGILAVIHIQLARARHAEIPDDIEIAEVKEVFNKVETELVETIKGLVNEESE